jgi:GAF domain-containing protein/HAMP domain-containing protein
MKYFLSSTETNDQSSRNALRISIFLLGVFLLVDIYNIFELVAFQQNRFDHLVATTMTFVLTILSVLGMWLSRRGRGEVAGWCLILGTSVGSLVFVYIQPQLGILFALTIVIITSIVASLTLPQRLIWRALSIIIFAGILNTALYFYLPGREELVVVYPPFIYGILALLMVLMISQLWGSASKNLLRKIVVWSGTIMAVLAVILVAYSIVVTRQAAIDAAQKQALSLAEAQAQGIAVKLDLPLLTARTMADSLEGINDKHTTVAMTREQINAMLEKVLEENPSFLGTYTLWEPNAFDGLDAQYAGTVSNDNSGRFIPYWVRGEDGAIHVEALKDYEAPGLGDWYLTPRATKKEATFAPLIYSIQGKEVVMASFIVPIIRDHKFYGVTGVDAPITFVQEIVDNIHLYNETANAVLLTDTGTLIAVHNLPDLVNKPATEVYKDFASLQPKIKAGEAFLSMSPDGKYLRVFSPIKIGGTGNNWSFGLIIPLAEITAPAATAAIRQVLIGMVLIILALVLLGYLSRQIVRPIQQLTGVANAISQGDLNATTNIDSSDETGILANAFNAMTAQLRNMLSTLEQRVADRTRNLELAAAVGQTVSQVRDLNSMLTNAAELIRKQFDLYYVQVYLTNPSQTALILKAGTGDAGEQLLARDHQLPLNINSINGRAAVEKRSVVISETAASTSFHPNPLLPATQSEMAVPLIIGEKVVGVLDMQSAHASALSQENLVAFEALAAQLAVAIQNANLLAETVQARSDIEAQAKRLSRDNWNNYLDAIYKPEKIGFAYQQDEIAPLPEFWEPKQNALVAPISVLGENLGNLVIELDEQSLIADDTELLDTVARQISVQIETLRLVDSADRYRLEAEEAARRTTIEGWKNYIESRPENAAGYMYDANEVKVLHEEPENSSLNMPILVRDEAIGKFSIQENIAQDDQSLDIAKAVVERLGAHVENLRLYDQSRSALMQSEKLFQASSQLTQATNLQELVTAVVTTLNIPAANRALLTTFQYGPSGDLEQLTIIGNWWNGSGHEVTPIGTQYPREVMRVMPMFISPTPVFFNDVFHDERVDATTLELIAKRLNLRSVAVLPLYSANKQLGALVLEGEEPHKFTAQEIRLFNSLAPQIATIMENRRQFEETQLARAQSEKLFNASQGLTQAANLQELVNAVAESMNIPVVNRAILDIFNYNAAGDLESMDVAATWWNGVGREPTGVGTHYSVNELSIMKIFLTPTPLFFDDALADERFDQVASQIAQSLNVRSGAVLPLYAGSRQLGILFLQAEEPHEFTTEEIRLFEVLAPQIATILENRQQYEQAQRQAQREAMLNTIGQKIQSATSVEAVLQIAARELGHALGAPLTIAQLSLKPNGNGQN